MKYIKVLIISTLLSPFLVLAYSENIIPGGENIGIEAHTEGIIVVGFYKVNGKYIGSDTLNVGDTILKIEGVEVSSIKEMSNLIDKKIKNNKVNILIKRNNKEKETTLNLVKEGNILKVDSFLNHQMDIDLINEIGKEFKKRFADCPITKILTIEASGIGIACIAAQYFDVPVVFAKKAQSLNLDGEMYCSKVESFTHKKVYDVILSKKFLGPEDHVLLIDDFLANGCALLGLINIVKESGATLEGAGIVIEKGFQNGGQKIRDMGVRLESLAIVDSMTDDSLTFRE